MGSKQGQHTENKCSSSTLSWLRRPCEVAHVGEQDGSRCQRYFSLYHNGDGKGYPVTPTAQVVGQPQVGFDCSRRLRQPGATVKVPPDTSRKKNRIPLVGWP